MLRFHVLARLASELGDRNRLICDRAAVDNGHLLLIVEVTWALLRVLRCNLPCLVRDHAGWGASATSYFLTRIAGWVAVIASIVLLSCQVGEPATEPVKSGQLLAAGYSTVPLWVRHTVWFASTEPAGTVRDEQPSDARGGRRGRDQVTGIGRPTAFASLAT